MIFNSHASMRKFFALLLLIAAFAASGCSFLHKRPEGPAQAPAAQQPAPAQTTSSQGADIALLLPLSGPYAAIANQIRMGAAVAVEELNARGVPVQLAEIDSFSDGWVAELKALPPSYSLVGGPLRPDAFQDVVMNDMNQERVFFTFLQGVSGATEGRDAWRFFSSPDDQLRTLLQTARREFGITNVGVLYPDEPFGKRIAQLFTEASSAHGVTIGAMQAYPPEEPLLWSEIVAELLYEGGKTTPIQAVFLPDVWSKVEMLVPYFFYHQREDLLLMGSTLWGQTLSETPNVDMHNFRLAVFPTAWWSESRAPAAVRLRRQLQGAQPSYWQVLGYDFVRFASRMGAVPPDWDAALVNRRIQQAQNMDWSMAPISWSQLGEAMQDMFLFTPEAGGMQPADLQEMRLRRQSVLSRTAN